MANEGNKKRRWTLARHPLYGYFILLQISKKSMEVRKWKKKEL
jgi:hypothetical protein